VSGVVTVIVTVILLANGFVPIESSLGRTLASTTSPQSSDAQIAATVGATMEVGHQVAVTPSTFWGLDVVTAASKGIVTDPALGSYLNATRFATFSYTSQSDQCNVTTNTQYQDDGSSVSPCGFNVASFKAWCDSKGAGCTSILTLPGENNNSREDANMASYIVHTIGFQPTYWAIGNEPSLWNHYGIPWKSWKTSDHKTPTPLAYAIDVKNAIQAVKKVDPSAKFIGIQADCECSPTWFAAVAQVDGASISAISYHTYPSAARSQSETQKQFFATLATSSNITHSYSLVRSYLDGKCKSCSTMPIFVTEYNSGPGWGPSNFAGTYQDAVFLAASTVQALLANVTTLDIFYLQTYETSMVDSWALMNQQNTVGPEGVLYEDLLSHMETGHAMAVKIVTTTGNVWAVMTSDGSKESLLVVNANITQSIDLNLNHALKIGSGTSQTYYQWHSGENVPSSTKTTSLPGSFTIPSEGILLIDWTS
jgi:hypothetical protein